MHEEDMDKKVFTYICGNSGPLDDYNPFKITGEAIVSEILYILNKEPLTVLEIVSTIKKDKRSVEKAIKSLLKINAIREENRKYKVNFAIFSTDDQKIVFHIGEQYGKQLAYKLLENRAELSNLVNTIQCCKYIEKGKIIFALIGCFALDWYCLEELEKKGFLRIHKKQPGRREYVLFGAEPSNINVSKLYCGSHNMSTGMYTFTSFGNAGPRSCLPDILGQASTAVLEHIKGDPDLREIFSNIFSLYGKDLLNDCGKILESLALSGEIRSIKNRDVLLNFLEKLKYISKTGKSYKVEIPVFLPTDRKTINKINERVSKIVCDFLDKNYLEIKDALSNIRPVLNKVPFEEIFVDVWHKIFGYCNMFLADEGFMFDPPETPYGGRYLAWITVNKKSRNERRATSCNRANSHYH